MEMPYFGVQISCSSFYTRLSSTQRPLLPSALPLSPPVANPQERRNGGISRTLLTSHLGYLCQSYIEICQP